MFVHFLQASATNWQRSLSPLYRDSIISLTLKTFKLWQYNRQNEKYIFKKGRQRTGKWRNSAFFVVQTANECRLITC